MSTFDDFMITEAAKKNAEIQATTTNRDYYKAAYARKIEEVDGLCRRLVEISEICQSAVGENATEEVTEELVMRIWEAASKRRTNL